MKVSIIVIAYNEENSISRCISSILNQTYHEFELIIVNDGSIDETENVIKQFGNKRLVYEKHSKNRGYASARNTGLSLAKGDYIFFTDADCIPQEDWIEQGLKFMENNPKIVAASGVTKELPIAEKKGSISNGTSYIKASLCYVYYFPSTMNSVYRRNILDELGGFDERYNRGGEDADLGFRIMKIRKVGHCENMIVFHKAKQLSLNRWLSLLRRLDSVVCLIKDHSRDYPKLRRSKLCYGFVVNPYFLLPLLFPPFIFLAIRTKNRKIASFKDIVFLVPYYLGIWYMRFIIWKTAFRERTFLI